eukprot:8074492-Alexandrium_andersonii.AAC.1
MLVGRSCSVLHLDDQTGPPFAVLPVHGPSHWHRRARCVLGCSSGDAQSPHIGLPERGCRP